MARSPSATFFVLGALRLAHKDNIYQLPVLRITESAYRAVKNCKGSSPGASYKHIMAYLKPFSIVYGGNTDSEAVGGHQETPYPEQLRVGKGDCRSRKSISEDLLFAQHLMHGHGEQNDGCFWWKAGRMECPERYMGPEEASRWTALLNEGALPQQLQASREILTPQLVRRQAAAHNLRT
jgi:hypothetical protein